MNYYKKFQRPLLLVALACFNVLLSSIPTLTYAANYPTKTIRLIVPFEPGGSSDITARIISEEMRKSLGQTIIVENLGGVGGSRGTEVVTKANPDGYTLVWGNVAPIAINQYLYKNLNYDAQKHLSPISLATIFPNVLVVQPGLKTNTFASFIAQTKKEYANLTFASAGSGSSTHLAGAWLNDIIGSNWLHVPFKGGGPALLAIAAGQVDFYFSAIPSALPFIRAGKVFPLLLRQEKYVIHLYPTYQPLRNKVFLNLKSSIGMVYLLQQILLQKLFKY
jgi:tripartite-type tricarboxylate transporter receptor subunit TctC